MSSASSWVSSINRFSQVLFVGNGCIQFFSCLFECSHKIRLGLECVCVFSVGSPYIESFESIVGIVFPLFVQFVAYLEKYLEKKTEAEATSNLYSSTFLLHLPSQFPD